LIDANVQRKIFHSNSVREHVQTYLKLMQHDMQDGWHDIQDGWHDIQDGSHDIQDGWHNWCSSAFDWHLKKSM